MKLSSSILANPAPAGGSAAPFVLLLVGFIAAFGAGKLPPVLPEIQVALDVSLLEAGMLVSSFQVAGAFIGMLVGAMADRFGPRRLVVAGLVALSAGSLTGAFAGQASLLLVSRAIESVGFAMASLPVPAILRASVPAERLGRWLGWWGTYMPVGFALALVISPWLAGSATWRAAWWLHAVMTLLAVALVLRFVQPPTTSAGGAAQRALSLGTVLRRTVQSPGPWICGITFGFYAGAYLGIVGFLPTIYQQAGIDPTRTGLLTALVAVVNVAGNVASGHLIHRGVAAHYLVAFASVFLAIGAWLTYAAGLSFLPAYLSITCVSAVMGLIPGSLFYLVNRYVSDSGIVSAGVGLMQQGSFIGQLVIPVIIAASAAGAAGWSNTFQVIAGLSAAIVLMTFVMHRMPR